MHIAEKKNETGFHKMIQIKIVGIDLRLRCKVEGPLLLVYSSEF